MRWEDVARGVRHEVGHAVNYSFELWKRPDWTATFGDFEQPYPKTTGSWPILPAEDFVEYVQDSGPHYAMKHADESWAEAFAAWLDTEFDVSGLRAGARRKLEYVDRIARECSPGGQPITRSESRRSGVKRTSVRPWAGRLAYRPR